MVRELRVSNVSRPASSPSVSDTNLKEESGFNEVMVRLESVQVCHFPFIQIIMVLIKRQSQAEKDKLEGDVSRLEEELSIIAVASRTLTACTVIPVIGQSHSYILSWTRTNICPFQCC